ERDRELIEECVGLLEKEKVDYTNFFTELRREGELIQTLRKNKTFDGWYKKWQVSRVKMANEMESEALMAKNNPVAIARNHIVEEVLKAAVDGEIKPLELLMEELSNPYQDSAKLQVVPSGFDAGYQTFCGT
ncbi:MAG: protein adenylyltransferase SelO family protein, partial [Cyclobacteriaceae bacterium]